MPKEYGGLQLNLIEALQTEEALAWVDGSTGWTVTLCAGANWFVGFLQPEMAKEVFSNKKACLAGSGKPSGIAKITSTGYEVNGFWKYATGSPHATVFTANCQIEENGVLLRDENDHPIVQSFWFKRNEVLVHKDWNCIGMIATASHSFEVKALTIRRERTFTIDCEHRFHHHPIYRFPFLQFAETTLAVNNAGMAVRFFDLCDSLFQKKRNGYQTAPKHTAMEKLNIAKEALKQARTSFYNIVQKSWEQLVLEGSINNDLLKEISNTSIKLANVARQQVDNLYPHCGLAAASADTEINRVWQNMHTASQHSLLL